MTYLITGATGLVGQELVKLCLENAINVHYLTTNKSKIKSQNNYKGFYWNPSANEIDERCFEGVTKIIHLAGASIAKRWTDTYKKTIFDSRVKTADILYQSLSKINHQVTHFIGASAIGIYPTKTDKIYDESSNEQASNFLSDVVQVWEKSSDQFSNLGVKLSKIRIGLVLAEKGGAFPQMVAPIKLYAGAAFGSGKQWQSWIHVKDLARLFLYVTHNSLEGTYNAVAPNHVNQNQLIKQAAQTINKPILLPNIPDFVAKLLMGEMSLLLLEGQKVSSQKIIDSGFQFDFPMIKEAVEDILK